MSIPPSSLKRKVPEPIVCVIIHAPAGKIIPASHLERAVRNNKDGWGMVALSAGRLVVSRGYQDGNSIVKEYEKFAKAGARVTVHARIGTCGEKGLANTHPFSIGKSNALMMHNGIINIDTSSNKRYCDSWHAAQFIAASIENEWKGDYGVIHDEIFKRSLSDWLKRYGGGSKLVLIDEDDVSIINEKAPSAFWLDGIWYSNDSATTSKSYAGDRLLSTGSFRLERPDDNHRGSRKDVRANGGSKRLSPANVAKILLNGKADEIIREFNAHPKTASLALQLITKRFSELHLEVDGNAAVVAELEAENAELKATVDELEERLADYDDFLHQNGVDPSEVSADNVHAPMLEGFADREFAPFGAGEDDGATHLALHSDTIALPLAATR
jgi:predicted HAD superfamily Cof-like phosphohydrolase